MTDHTDTPDENSPKPQGTRGPMLLQQYHYLAIEMRYAGTMYKDIALKLTQDYQSGRRKAFLETTVRRWFASGGMLEHHYLDYARKENERRRRMVLEEVKKLLPKIPGKLEDLLDRKIVYLDKRTGEVVKTDEPLVDKTTLAAIRTLIEMLGFKLAPHSDGEDPADRFFERLENEQDDVATG